MLRSSGQLYALCIDFPLRYSLYWHLGDHCDNIAFHDMGSFRTIPASVEDSFCYYNFWVTKSYGEHCGRKIDRMMDKYIGVAPFRKWLQGIVWILFYGTALFGMVLVVYILTWWCGGALLPESAPSALATCYLAFWIVQLVKYYRLFYTDWKLSDQRGIEPRTFNDYVLILWIGLYISIVLNGEVWCVFIGRLGRVNARVFIRVLFYWEGRSWKWCFKKVDFNQCIDIIFF